MQVPCPGGRALATAGSPTPEVPGPGQLEPPAPPALLAAPGTLLTSPGTYRQPCCQAVLWSTRLEEMDLTGADLAEVIQNEE